MSRLAELEAACFSSGWERAQLAVYGDALQAAGDPRGELVAIDLHAEARGPTDELDERRRELLGTWLGELAGSRAVRCVWGFVELTLDRETPDPYTLAKLLGGPAGPFLRGLELAGDATFIANALALVAGAPRRRLAALAITQPGASEQPTIAGKAATELIRATPILETLVVRGGAVFGAFPHPTVRRARVAGFNAIGSLVGAGPALPALIDLDFAFHREWVTGRYPTPRADQLDRLLRGTPALRRLDLSRNEPVPQPWGFALRTDVFKLLRELSIKRQLTHLRMPSITAPTDVANLQASLDRMPELVELEITRLFEPPAGGRPTPIELFHPATLILPGESTWVPRTHARGRDALQVEVPGHALRLVVELLDAVKLMETSYRKLPIAARAAWDKLWTRIDALLWERPDGTPDSIEVPAGLLAHALAIDGLERRWLAVREALRARSLAPEALVRLRRIWSY